MLEFFEHFFRDSSDPMVVLERDARIATTNEALTKLLERGKRGVPFLELVADAERDRVRTLLVRAAGGEQVLIEVPHDTASGTTLIEWHFFPIEGALTAGIGRHRDGQRALGDELGRTRAELLQKRRMLDEIQMELTQVPFIDAVTGVWNRMQVIERLTGEWSRSERWGSPIACLMIEVSDLEDLRRCEGDHVANEVLKSTARRIKTVVRDHDIVGRYGQSVFVVVAVHCSLRGAQSLARRLLDGIRGEPVQAVGTSVDVDAAIGCCTNRSESVEIMEDLFGVALDALREAREQDEAIYCAEDGRQGT